MWSITGYKGFLRCQRQWYYKNRVADARVKNDAYRKEVTLLSRLQSIEAWRGNIVDDIISRLLVNAINQKYPLKKEYFIKEALEAFDRQLEYAMFQKYREPDLAYAKDKDFAALIPFEFGTEVPDQILQQARADIETALENLFGDNEFIEYLKSAKLLISQRPLKYQFDHFTVEAKPDLIAFFHDGPPHIFDWKVHAYGTNTYDEQLISYAVALFKVNKIKPHSDFPADLSKYRIYDYKLSEYQLLHKERIRRDYTITEERLTEFGDNLSSGIIQMYMAGAHKKYSELVAEDFSTTSYVENCLQCGFKKICK